MGLQYSILLNHNLLSWESFTLISTNLQCRGRPLCLSTGMGDPLWSPRHQIDPIKL